MMPNMASQWSIGLLALALLPWAQALPSPTPLPTISQPSVISTPSPTPTQTLRHRRAAYSDPDDEYDDDSTSTSTPTLTLTSSLSPNVCGYFDGIKLTCDDDEECIFHMPDRLAGMVGCCDISNRTKCRSFNTACYDNDKFKATPTLTSGTDPLALTCTESYSAACASYAYSDFHITDYICRSTHTEYTMSTSRLSTFDGTVFLFSKSISTVDDDFIRSWTSRNQTESREIKTTALSSVAAPSSTITPDAGGSKESESSSSPSAGTIAGAVVGSIVGVGAIVGAGVLFVLFKKRRGREGKDDLAPPAPPEGQAPAGYQSVSNSSPSGWELDQSVKTEGASQQDVTEMEGSRPVSNFTGQTGTGAANQFHEMDGSNFISELPAGRPRS